LLIHALASSRECMYFPIVLKRYSNLTGIHIVYDEAHRQKIGIIIIMVETNVQSVEPKALFKSFS